MKLHYQSYGNGSPLIIAHGLFGTYENWGSQIKQLTERFNVIALDLRNHGRSPHSDEMSYPLMAVDIIELMDDLNITQAAMLGHSMGGKAMMELALNYPDRVSQLIVVDIAPVEYAHHHDRIFDGLLSLDIDQLTSRKAADEHLQQYVDDLGVRAFLLKNLYRTEDKTFAWRMNIPALQNQYDNISKAPEGSPYEGPTLFIKGANSDYLLPKHREQVVSLFPNAGYKMIAGAGHWPHAEKPEVFSKHIHNFLTD